MEPFASMAPEGPAANFASARLSEEIAIFRTANGSVYALVNKCPHKQGPLSQGIVHDTSVTCPLHNWRISLITGEALGEDKGCVPTIPVKIEGGRIMLSRAEALVGVGAGVA